jgi:hypothetical protein
MDTKQLTMMEKVRQFRLGWRIGLADNWKRLHTRGTVIASGAMGMISLFGPELREAWASMPDDLKQIVPATAQKAIAYAILFCTLVAIRYAALKRTAKPESSDAANHP